MIEFLKDNLGVVFGGTGAAVVAALLGFFLKRRTGSENGPKQDATAGTSAQIVQAGRDATVGDFYAHKTDK